MSAIILLNKRFYKFINYLDKGSPENFLEAGKNKTIAVCNIQSWSYTELKALLISKLPTKLSRP